MALKVVAGMMAKEQALTTGARPNLLWIAGAAMGGIGSGWQCERKLAVEECLTLPASLFRREVAEGASASGTVSWSHPGADPFASIRYAATLSHDGSGYIRLRYMARGESMDYRVRLVTTRPNYGGLRWWFLCPANAERGVETRSQALPPASRQGLRLPGGPRPHLPIVPRELAIPRLACPACGGNLMEPRWHRRKP